MKKLIVFAAAGMVVLGLLTSGCAKKKPEDTPKTEQTTPAPSPVKKAPAPVGC